jgi:hypothetical protein
MIKIEKMAMFDFLHIKNHYLLELKRNVKKIITYQKIKLKPLLNSPPCGAGK